LPENLSVLTPRNFLLRRCPRSCQEASIFFSFAQVQEILLEGEGNAQRASGVRLADGRVFRGKTVVSNATRWDTFEKLMGGEERLPPSEKAFRKRYKKSPSFLSIHMGVRADVLPAGSPPPSHVALPLTVTHRFSPTYLLLLAKEIPAS
jgi:hypothetical protein